MSPERNRTMIGFEDAQRIARERSIAGSQTIELPPTLAVTPLDGEQPVDPNQPIAATATLSANPAQPTGATMTTKVDLNVRRGPSTEYDIIILDRTIEPCPAL